MQDSIFPTVAYVGGPAECRYFGQCSTLFELFDLPVPLVAPRARFRLVDARTRERLAALGLSPADAEQPLDKLLAFVGASRPTAVQPAELRAAILYAPLEALASLPARIGTIGSGDRQLARAFNRTRATIHLVESLLARKNQEASSAAGVSRARRRSCRAARW